MNSSTKRKLLLYAGGSAAALALSGGLLASGAFAATTSTPDSPMQSLISKIATKFNLNESDVKAVFDQDKADHQAAMQQKEEDRLTQAVTDGKLTQAQKDLIVAKEKELQTAHEAARTSGTKPTQDEMKAERDALTKWASNNGIDMKWLRPMGGPGMRHHGGPKGDGAPDDGSMTRTDATDSTDMGTSTATPAS